MKHDVAAVASTSRKNAISVISVLVSVMICDGFVAMSVTVSNGPFVMSVTIGDDPFKMSGTSIQSCC